MLKESDALAILQKERELFPPLELVEVKEAPTLLNKSLDFRLSMKGRRGSFEFLVEYKSGTSPKVFEAALAYIQKCEIQESFKQLGVAYYPMVMMPYLSEENLLRLEETQVSGLDLCGNGIIVIPPDVLLFRTGRQNKYPDSRPVQNPFSGKSSLIARMLLLQSEYSGVSELHEQLLERGAEIALSTVSKSLQSLEEELVVVKRGRTIKVLQPDAILARLANDYRLPEPKAIYKGKSKTSNLQELSAEISLTAAREKLETAMVWCGNINPYASMTRPNSLVQYVSDEVILEHIQLDTKSKFPNVELRILKDPQLYFDRRTWHSEIQVLSPIELYLQLMSGDKRDQEIAEQVMQTIDKERQTSQHETT